MSLYLGVQTLLSCVAGARLARYPGFWSQSVLRGAGSIVSPGCGWWFRGRVCFISNGRLDFLR